MNQTTVEKASRKQVMHFSHDPLRVWITTQVHIEIEKGDKLSDVAREIAKTLPDLEDPLQLAAYYFDLGERVASDEMGRPWQGGPPTNNRRYLYPIGRRKERRNRGRVQNR